MFDVSLSVVDLLAAVIQGRAKTQLNNVQVHGADDNNNMQNNKMQNWINAVIDYKVDDPYAVEIQ